MGEFNFVYEGSFKELVDTLHEHIQGDVIIMDNEHYIELSTVIGIDEVPKADDIFFRRVYENELSVPFDDLIYDLNFRYVENLFLLNNGTYTYSSEGFNTWIDNTTFNYDVNTKVLDHSFVDDRTDLTRKMLSGIEGIKIID